MDNVVQKELINVDWNDHQTNQRSFEEVEKEIIEKYHFDRPLFYFSIGNKAVSDSLNYIYPSNKRRFIKNIFRSYGNDSIAIQFVNQIRNEVDKNSLLHEIYYSKNEFILKQKLEKLPFGNKAILLEEFETLKQSAPNYLQLIPTFTWNGKKNRYQIWLSDLVKGDLGRSVSDGLPIRYRLFPALFISFILGSISIVILFLLGIPVGILISKYDKSLRWVPQILYTINAMPLFWISELLIVFFASKSLFYLFPSFGIGAGNSIQFKYLILPVASLVISALPIVVMQTKSAIDVQADQPYAMVARVKGLSQIRIYFKHILRNALSPIITLFTSFLPATVGGVMIVEYVYSIPGMGRLLIDAINKNDFPLILIIIILIGIIKIISNLLADIAYRIADPRISFK